MPFLVFFILPIVELWLLIRVGAAIGATLTVALVLATAALGIGVINRQGLRTLTRARAGLARGAPPAAEMIEGLLRALAGLLLVLPGPLTDTAGLLGLIPGLRRWLARRLLASGRLGQPGAGRGDLIEGDYERED
ncbi:MAG: FxsA family protein [Pseudomonadota bacterium]